MEIQNHKRAIMQGARVLILFQIVCLLSINSCAAQQKLSGSFKRVDPTIASKEISVEYRFSPNGEFEQITNLHLGSKEFSKGRFFIKNDTLTLNFVPYDTSDTSNMAFQKTKIQVPPIFKETESSLIAKIVVLGEDMKPIKGANLLMQDKEGKQLMVFISDGTGEFPTLNIQSDLFHKIIVSSLGQQEVEIPTASLFGFDSHIEIIMKSTDSIYSKSNKIEKYHFKQQNKKEIRMTKLPDGEKIILLRI
ncbi:hypothetical protein [Flagellimonas amoyensis]|uniref:hypothetical protein n=1 Tax=Flagellimonas amoyensis TaxID=2169401 RepID=UPI000D3919D7|nr:hypothetical protein [Allomuricauda amoyensis]